MVLEVDFVCRCRRKGPETRFNKRRLFIGILGDEACKAGRSDGGAGNDNMEGRDAAAAIGISVAKSFFAYVMALN